MAYGKKIELFLKDGTYSGTVTAEMSNWNGKGVKVARESVDDEEEELDEIGVGVYFLFCGKPASSVYIGESDDIKKRLKQHIAAYATGTEKFYWEVAVCILGRDLDKAKIQYLEDLLVRSAKTAGSFEVLTKSSRSDVKIKNSVKEEMNEFAEYAKTLVEVLGYKVFARSAKPVRADAPTEPSEEPIKEVPSSSSYPLFRIDKPKLSLKATMEKRGDKEYVLLPGSVLSSKTYDSFWEKLVILRKESISKGTVDGNMVLTKELIFESPSAAAVFVLGRSANGKTEWRDPTGKTYAEWLSVHGSAGE